MVEAGWQNFKILESVKKPCEVLEILWHVIVFADKGSMQKITNKEMYNGLSARVFVWVHADLSLYVGVYETVDVT